MIGRSFLFSGRAKHWARPNVIGVPSIYAKSFSVWRHCDLTRCFNLLCTRDDLFAGSVIGDSPQSEGCAP
jgi:hypothetical protein